MKRMRALQTFWFGHRAGSGATPKRRMGNEATNAVIASVLLVAGVVGASGTAFVVMDVKVDVDAPIIANIQTKVTKGSGFWADGDERVSIKHQGGNAILTKDLKIIVEMPTFRFTLNDADLKAQVGPYFEVGEEVVVETLIRPGDEISVMVVGTRNHLQNLVQAERGMQAIGLASFGVAPDGAIFTRCPIHANGIVVGTEITYGAGGPAIPVKVSLSRNGGGTYNPMFGGLPVVTSQTESLGTVHPGERLGIQTSTIHPLFKKTYESIDGLPRIYVLLDGDTPPDYAGFDGQAPLETFLAPYVDTSTGTMDLDPKEAMILVEFTNDLASASADFQDLVFLFSFASEVCPN